MPAVVFNVDMVDMDQLIADIPISQRRLEIDVEQEINRVGVLAWRMAKDNAPVFQGDLRTGIKFEPATVRLGGAASLLGGGFEFNASIRTSTPPYDEVMEEGRAPGRTPPPPNALKRWVRLKAQRGQFKIDRKTGERPDAAVARAAFRLAQSIGRKGTRARHFMKKADDFAQVEIFRRLQFLVELWSDQFERNMLRLR